MRYVCGQNKKVNCEILVMRQDIIKQLRAEGNMAAEAVDSEDEHKPNLLRDIVDDETSLAFVDIKIGGCVREFADLLTPYTKDITERPMLYTSKDKVPEMYEISMNVPASIAQNSIGMLSELAKEYITCRIMSEVFGRYGFAVQDAAEKERLAEITRKIDACKNRRAVPIRRTMV